MRIRCAALILLAVFGAACGNRAPEPGVLRIALLFDLAGPQAHRGTVTSRAVGVLADEVNSGGGLVVDGRPYRIELVLVDGEGAASRMVDRAERLVGSGDVGFFIGPDTGAAARRVMPVLEAARAVVVHFSHDRTLARESGPFCLLGTPLPSQVFPRMLRVLAGRDGIQSVAFIAGNNSNGLMQMAFADRSAASAGIRVLRAPVFDIEQATFQSTLEPEVQRRRIGRVVELQPDAIVLTGVPPAELPAALVMIRETGFEGTVFAPEFHDAHLLAAAGDAADGFVCVAGGSVAAPPTPRLEALRSRYIAKHGVWDEEAEARLYALETLLQLVARAGAGALEDRALLIDEIDSLTFADPFIDRPEPVGFSGSGDLGRTCQIAVPYTIAEFRDGVFHPLPEPPPGG